MKRHTKKIIKFLLIILIAILLEITLFNFRYWQVKMSGLEEKQIAINEEDIKKDVYEDFKFKKEIEIELDEKILNLKYNISINSKKNVVISTKFVDNSAKYIEKELEDIVYNVNFKDSEYLVLNSMQECKKINIEIESYNTVDIDSITINTWYFDFNIYRVLLIILVGMLITNLKYINNFFEKNKQYKNIVYITIIGVIFVGYLAYAQPYSEYLGKFAYIDNSIREDPYKLLTKSLMNGTVEIEFDDTSKQTLLSLDNYQDHSERDQKVVRYLFDFAFYNGSYYCYYGIVPVLTVLLPIALIFGVYFSSNVICIVYSLMCIILLQRIYNKLMKKYNINLKFTTEIIGFLTLFLATGIFVLMGSANFYQAADLCGIAWGLFATYLILLLDNNIRIKLKLFFIGLFFALMVCSRPIYVLYIIPILICVFKYIIHDKKIDIRRIIAFTVPIIIIAIAQMYYNYIRFDNIFEFGQFYNLTINNTADQKMDLGRAIEGTIAYLVNPPKFKMQYPFVESVQPIVMNGNNIYVEPMLGLIWFSYLWIFFFSRKIIKLSKSKTLKWISISLLVLTIIMCSVNTCLAGMNQRYLVDIQPALAILACIMWFIYIKNNNENEKYCRNDFFEFIIKLSLIITSIFALSKIDYNAIDSFSDDYKKIGKVQYYIEKIICFYK